MRVERFRSNDVRLKSVGKTAKKASTPATDDAAEQIDDDFSPTGGGAAGLSSEGADPEHFPGILEGLSPDYIGRATASGPFDFQKQPTLTREQILQCLDVQHSRTRLEKSLQDYPPSHPLREVLEEAAREEALLAKFVGEEKLQTQGGHRALVDALVAASPLPLGTLEYSSLEHALNPTKSALFEPFCHFSQNYFAHRYLVQLVGQTQELFASFLKEISHPLTLRLRVRQSDENNAGYEWIEGQHRLSLLVCDPLNDIRTEWPELPTAGSFQQEYQYRRGTSDLVSVIHEYAHAVYDHLLGIPASADLGIVNRALSEGFAILCELLLLDALAHRANSAPRDSRDFQERRFARIDWLQEALEPDSPSSHLAYAEGVELMTNLFRRGGFSEITDFINRVNPSRANSLSRSHPDYRENPTNPDKVLSLLGG